MKTVITDASSSLSHFTCTTHCPICGFCNVPCEQAADSLEVILGPCPDCDKGMKRLKDIPLPSGVIWWKNNRIKSKWKLKRAIMADGCGRTDEPYILVEYHDYGIGLTGLSPEEVQQLRSEIERFKEKEADGTAIPQ